MKAKIPIILGHQLQISRENEAISPLLILDRVVKVGAEGRPHVLLALLELAISASVVNSVAKSAFVRSSVCRCSCFLSTLSLSVLFPLPLSPSSAQIPPNPTSSLPHCLSASIPVRVRPHPTLDRRLLHGPGWEGGRASCLHRLYLVLSSFLLPLAASVVPLLR